MSFTLGVVKREGAQGASLNKVRRSQLLNDFCIFSTTKKHFQHP